MSNKFETQALSKSKEAQALSSDLEGLNCEFNSLLNENTVMKNELDMVKKQLESELERAREKDKEIRELIKQKADQDMQLSKLLYEASLKQSIITNLSNKENELTTELSQVNKKLVKLHEFELEKEKKDKYDTLHILTEECDINSIEMEELDMLKQQNFELIDDNQSLKMNEQILKKEIVALRKVIEELEAKLKNFMEDSFEPAKAFKPMESRQLELDFKLMSSRKMSEKLSYFPDIQSQSSFRLSRRSFIYRASSHKKQTPSKLNDDVLKILEQNSNIFILKERGLRKSEAKTFMFYHCRKQDKVLRKVTLFDGKLFIFKIKKTKPVLVIPILNIRKVFTSQNDEFLVQIFYVDSEGSPNTFLMEIPRSKIFLSILKEIPFFNNNIFCLDLLEIESDMKFRNVSINLFKSAKGCSMVNYWVNSFFKDWVIYFTFFIDEILVKFECPDKISYEQQLNDFAKLEIHRLDDYNVITDNNKIGLVGENLMGIKIRNENKDLVFEINTFEEKMAWKNALN